MHQLTGISSNNFVRNFTRKSYTIKKGSFPFVPPPPVRYAPPPPLQRTCHYIANRHVRIWHVRRGFANNMHPPSLGEGTNGKYLKKKLPCATCSKIKVKLIYLILGVLFLEPGSQFASWWVNSPSESAQAGHEARNSAASTRHQTWPGTTSDCVSTLPEIQ